jgi:hypothetical protein
LLNTNTSYIIVPEFIRRFDYSTSGGSDDESELVKILGSYVGWTKFGWWTWEVFRNFEAMDLIKVYDDSQSF